MSRMHTKTSRALVDTRRFQRIPASFIDQLVNVIAQHRLEGVVAVVGFTRHESFWCQLLAQLICVEGLTGCYDIEPLAALTWG